MALTKVTGSVIKDSVSLSGNVSVGGTLTYQDVTNVDALGIGTFRTGIKVLAGQVDVGSNIKLGNAGVITATSFSGAVSGTTGSFSGSVTVGQDLSIPDKIVHSGDSNTAIRFPTNDIITAETGGSERLRIDSSGRLMIGNTNASTMYQDGGDDLVIGNTSGSHGMTIISQNNNVGRIMWSDTYTSGTGTYEGQILYSHATNTLNFYANHTNDSSVKMQLGSSQNQLFVGIDKGGTTTHSNRSALFHRTGANGNMISITSDTNAIAGIVFGDSIANTTANYESYMYHENSTNDFWIRVNAGSDSRHLKIRQGGNVEIGNGNLVLADGHGIDFSADGNTSGMTGELLDDYETGTWIPDVTASSGSDTWSYRRAGKYTKIGNKVTASWSLGQYNGNLSGGIQISNLPFTNEFRQYGGDIGFYEINPPTNTCGYFIYLEGNTTIARPYFTINGSSGVQCTGAHLYASNRTFWEG